MTEAHRELAAKILKWARKHYKEKAKGEFSFFAHYVNIALAEDTLSVRYTGHVASLYQAYMKERGEEEPAEAKKAVAV